MVSPQRNRASVEPPLLLSAVLANPQSLTVSRKIANEGLRARQLAVSLCSIETPVASRSVHHARMNKREDAKRATARAERIEALQRWQRNHDSNNGAVNQSKLVTQPLLPSSPVQQLSLHDSAILTKEALGNLVNQYVYALGEEAASGVSSPAMPASPTTGDSSGTFPPKGMPAAAGLLRTSSPERSKAQQHAQKFLQRARGEHSESGAGSTVDGDMHSRRQRDANLIDIGTKKLDDSMSSFVKECGFVTVNATPQELRARRLEEEESVVHAKRKAREAEQGYIRQAMVKETERQVRHLLKHVVHIKNMSTTAGSVQEALEAKMQPQVVMNYFRGAVNTAGGHSVTTAGGHSGIAGASSTTFGGGGLRRKNLLQPLPLLGGSNKESNISVVVPSGPVGLHRSYVSSVDSNQGGGTSYTTVVVQGPTVPSLTHGHHLLHHHSFLALGVEATGGSSVLTNTIDELLLTASSPNNTTTMQQNNQQLSPNMSHHQSLAQQHHHRSYASQRDHTAMTSTATTCSPARTSTAANKAALLSTVSATTQFRLGVLLRCVVALVSLHFPTSRAFADRFRKGASVGSVGSKVIPPQQRLPLSWVSLVASMFPAWFPCTCSLVANINAVVASWTTSDDLPDDNHNTLTGIATPLIAVTEEGTVDLEGWLYVCAMLLEQDDIPSSFDAWWRWSLSTFPRVERLRTDFGRERRWGVLGQRSSPLNNVYPCRGSAWWRLCSRRGFLAPVHSSRISTRWLRPGPPVMTCPMIITTHSLALPRHSFP
ncbi:Hypothetical protein, putative [Bodo saltans]|uniref:Uncharacterized protein n=1 Tax=Bodo saltans TaxID=75058 RepID=A0A0S4IYW2_BODSA|nr:Hypothetical protein, putative [Bodo saltans]|eukprot:CUG13978.1 Hypothetical protein, putative [Bodo saltans]